MATLSFIKDSVYSEEYASRQGFLQQLDPRLKIISFVIFIITAILVNKTGFLLLLYLVCLLLAVFSKVSPVYFIQRTWIFIPLFSLLIVLPALFDVFSPGEPVLAFKLFSVKLVITGQGLHSATLFVLRVLVSVSYAVLLSLTTRHSVLLSTLRIFRIPQVFVMTLGMCYRYIYLFVEIIENTFLAIKSRTGCVLHFKKGQRLVAWNIANLWQRSYRLSQQVYASMVSRGFNGEAVVLLPGRIKFRDLAWFLFVLLFSCAMLYLN